MSSLEAFVIVTAVLLGGLPSTYLLIRRARRAGSERDRIVRAAHERATTAAVADGVAIAEAALAGRLPADVEDRLTRFLLDHPDVADGFARLDQTIRDDQNNKGEA